MTNIKPNNYVVVLGWMITDLNLSGADLMVYATIYGFSQDGTNQYQGSIQYLADWANVTRRTAIRSLNALMEKGLIKKEEYSYRGQQFNSYKAVTDVIPSDKMSPLPVTKCHSPSDKMSPNILVDNTKDILDKEKDKQKEIPYGEIVEYLNMRTGSHYKASSQKTKSLIAARFNEGFTVEDFMTVIDKKCTQWINDPKMCEYLRPETLFSNKFEGYLNQQMKKKQTLSDINITIDDDYWDFMEG